MKKFFPFLHLLFGRFGNMLAKIFSHPVVGHDLHTAAKGQPFKNCCPDAGSVIGAKSCDVNNFTL